MKFIRERKKEVQLKIFLRNFVCKVKLMIRLVLECNLKPYHCISGLGEIASRQS